MKTARRYVAEDKAAQAGSELEVARISLRQSKASEQFAAPAAAAEQRNRAIATYQVLILRAEGAEPGVLRHIEDAYYECIPLLLETERWQDALDDCQQYLQTFKSGRYVPAVSTWLNRAKAALATRASAPPAAGGAP
jgi:hypothetical protein